MKSSDTEFLWKRICDELENRIRRRYHAYERLGCLSDICSEFGCCMITARRVFQELARRNLIIKKPRVGAIVLPIEKPKLELNWVVTFQGYKEHQFGNHSLDSTFYLHAMKALEKECVQRNVESRTRVYPFSPLPEEVKTGLCFCSFCGLQDFYAVLRRRNLPGIWFNAPPGRHLVSSVQADLVAGGYLAGRHLIECGYRRIAILRNCVGDVFADCKEEGVRRALNEAGLSLSPDRIKYTPGDTLICPGEITEEEAFDELWAQDEKPDAVFCVNDYRVLRLLDYCSRKGIRVPDQLGLIGYDNIDDCEAAGITTVDLRMDRMAQNLIELAEELVLFPDKRSRGMTRVVKPDLIIRNTTRIRRH